jgi:hypothetical protein
VSKDRSAATANTASAGGYQPGGPLPATGNRLPTAGRERKPALAALAVLLILAGALATMVLVNRSGNRVSVIEMTHTVAAGTRIQAGDMTEVQVAADSNIHYVLFSQIDKVAGGYAGTTLVGGSLLVQEMLDSSQHQALAAGQAMVGYLFKEGQYPVNQLQPGQVVELWQTNGGGTGTGNGNGGNNGNTNGGTNGGSNNNQSTPQPYATKPLCQATILAASRSGDALDLTLAVPENQVGQLEALAGNVSIALAANTSG